MWVVGAQPTVFTRLELPTHRISLKLVTHYFMPTTVYASPTPVPAWHKLYQAALFETEEREVPVRIAEAERAIVQRSRELIDSTTDNIEENEALEDALYGLQALQNSMVREREREKEAA